MMLIPLTSRLRAAAHHCHALDQLELMLTRLRQKPIQHFEDYESEVHALFAPAEREILADDLSSLDIDVPAIEVNGTGYHRALRCFATYQSAVGAIKSVTFFYHPVARQYASQSPLALSVLKHNMSKALSVFHHAPGIFRRFCTTARFELSISPDPMGRLAASAPW